MSTLNKCNSAKNDGTLKSFFFSFLKVESVLYEAFNTFLFLKKTPDSVRIDSKFIESFVKYFTFENEKKTFKCDHFTLI